MNVLFQHGSAAPAGLAGISDAELLAELLRRNPMGPAPTTQHRTPDHVEVTLGIGRDHIAEIILHEDAVAALKAVLPCR